MNLLQNVSKSNNNLWYGNNFIVNTFQKREILVSAFIYPRELPLKFTFINRVGHKIQCLLSKYTESRNLHLVAPAASSEVCSFSTKFYFKHYKLFIDK